MKSCLIVAVVMSIGVPTSAYAYIDPGTGSLIIQGIIGAIAGIGVTAKIYWHKIRIFFAGENADTADSPEESVSRVSENPED